MKQSKFTLTLQGSIPFNEVNKAISYLAHVHGFHSKNAYVASEGMKEVVKKVTNDLWNSLPSREITIHHTPFPYQKKG